MYTLVLLANMTLLGTYANMASCQNAMHEIYAVKMNPHGKRLPEVDEAIKARMQYSKDYVCLPVSKD
jgi:SpoVK/Ycf46/Vps4 family AAA+-type ATPase